MAPDDADTDAGKGAEIARNIAGFINSLSKQIRKLEARNLALETAAQDFIDRVDHTLDVAAGFSFAAGDTYLKFKAALNPNQETS